MTIDDLNVSTIEQQDEKQDEQQDEQQDEKQEKFSEKQSSKDFEKQIKIANARAAAALAEIEALKAENTLILEKAKMEKAKEAKEAKEAKDEVSPSTEQNFNWSEQRTNQNNFKQMPLYMTKREFSSEMRRRIFEKINNIKRK